MRNHLIAFSLALMFASSSPVADPIRLSLEAESRKWFFWLLIAGAVVALGCILEIPETRFSLMQWWRQKRGRPLKEENPTSWRIPAASVGLLLVIVGVVGEVVFEGLVSNADTKLRTHESDVLSLAETTAGQANERASKNEKEAARLRKEAEDERMARVKLQEQLQWRYLSKEQKEAMTKVLKTAPGSEVNVWMIADGGEAQGYGDDFVYALEDSGWKVHVKNGIGIRLLPSICVHDGLDRSTAILNKALDAAHIGHCQVGGDPLRIGSAGTELWIGPKLPPTPERRVAPEN